jgi:hypothetical protein
VPRISLRRLEYSIIQSKRPGYVKGRSAWRVPSEMLSLFFFRTPPPHRTGMTFEQEQNCVSHGRKLNVWSLFSQDAEFPAARRHASKLSEWSPVTPPGCPYAQANCLRWDHCVLLSLRKRSRYIGQDSSEKTIRTQLQVACQSPLCSPGRKRRFARRFCWVCPIAYIAHF